MFVVVLCAPQKPKPEGSHLLLGSKRLADPVPSILFREHSALIVAIPGALNVRSVQNVGNSPKRHEMAAFETADTSAASPVRTPPGVRKALRNQNPSILPFFITPRLFPALAAACLCFKKDISESDDVLSKNGSPESVPGGPW